MMAKYLLAVCVIAFFVSAVAGGADSSGSKKAEPLGDGFGLAGIDGVLVVPDSNNFWAFKVDSEVSDDRGRIRAGTAIELLPSSTLEHMMADANERSGASYRLWGRVTKYRGKNFVFPTYYLRVGEATVPTPLTPKSLPKRQSGPAVNDPNDILTLPEELMDKLQARRIARSEPAQKESNAAQSGAEAGERKSEVKPDSVLAERTGFLVEQDGGYGLFAPDALGRRVEEESLRLLPCWTLEQAERQQAAEPERVRHKIAGIVTMYKGTRYLLLQRAIRVYSHGNFGR